MVIAIGPRGQEVLRPWFRLKLEEYLFQPLEAEMARDAERRQYRKTKITPSQARRRPTPPRVMATPFAKPASEQVRAFS